MAQSVSCGTFKWEGGRGWSKGLSVNPDNLASCWYHYCVASIVFPYLSCTLQLVGFPLENDIRHPLLKAANRRAASLGYCRESGPLCWVFQVCNTRLGTGDLEFFFSFSSFKSNQLRQGASYRHYQVDFQKNKSSSAILYTASGKKKAEQKPYPA